MFITPKDLLIFLNFTLHYPGVRGLTAIAVQGFHGNTKEAEVTVINSFNNTHKGHWELFGYYAPDGQCR